MWFRPTFVGLCLFLFKNSCWMWVSYLIQASPAIVFASGMVMSKKKENRAMISTMKGTFCLLISSEGWISSSHSHYTWQEEKAGSSRCHLMSCFVLFWHRAKSGTSCPGWHRDFNLTRRTFVRNLVSFWHPEERSRLFGELVGWFGRRTGQLDFCISRVLPFATSQKKTDISTFLTTGRMVSCTLNVFSKLCKQNSRKRGLHVTWSMNL